MICENIRQLRLKYGMSQADLAKKLDVTRSSVNAWESGLSTPTTQYIVALARLFHVSADYLLGMDGELRICLSGYSPEEVKLICDMLRYFDSNRK